MPFTLVHGLIPYALASIFTKNKILRWIALLGGMFPDLDGLHIFFDMNLYRIYHHELLHAPIWGFIIAIPIAILAKKFYGIKMWKSYLAFSLGFLLHGLTDVHFTNWYVKLLSPFSQEKFSNPIFYDYHFLLALLISIYIFIKLYQFIRTGKSLKEEIKELLPNKSLFN